MSPLFYCCFLLLELLLELMHTWNVSETNYLFKIVWPITVYTRALIHVHRHIDTCTAPRNALGSRIEKVEIDTKYDSFTRVLGVYEYSKE